MGGACPMVREVFIRPPEDGQGVCATVKQGIMPNHPALNNSPKDTVTLAKPDRTRDPNAGPSSATTPLDSGFSEARSMSSGLIAIQDGVTKSEKVTAEMMKEMDDLREENQRMKADRMCRICMDKEVQVGYAATIGTFQLMHLCISYLVVSNSLFSGYLPRLWPSGHLCGLCSHL